MKIFRDEVSFLRELMDSASVGIFKSRHDVFLGQLSISCAGVGGNTGAVGEVCCLVLRKWFGSIMAIFGLLQFWPNFDFYLLSVP